MESRLNHLDQLLRLLLAERGEVLTQPPSTLAAKQRLLRMLMNIREPHPLSKEILRLQDEELRQQREERGVVRIEEEGIVLWQGDITRLQVDAIVNAANAQMLGCFAPLHTCIDNCIHSAAGLQLREACHQRMQGGELATGEAVITKGYNLPAQWVIHTVGPICTSLSGTPSIEQQEELAACYRNSLRLADEVGARSIAFCCISTGVFRFPSELAAEIAVQTVKAYSLSHPECGVKTIIFNVFKDQDYALYQRLLSRS